MNSLDRHKYKSSRIITENLHFSPIEGIFTDCFDIPNMKDKFCWNHQAWNKRSTKHGLSEEKYATTNDS